MKDANTGLMNGACTYFESKQHILNNWVQINCIVVTLLQVLVFDSEHRSMTEPRRK